MDELETSPPPGGDCNSESRTPVPPAISQRASAGTPQSQLSAFALLCHSAFALTLAAILKGAPDLLVSLPLGICGCMAGPVALAAGLFEAAVRRGRSPVVVSTVLLLMLIWHLVFPRLWFLPDAALKPVVLAYCAYSLCLGALTLSRAVRARWNS